MTWGIIRRYDSILDYISRDFTIKAKKLIAYPATWILYGIGSFIWNEFKSMQYAIFWVWSCKVQQWGKLTKPWI